MPVVHAIFTDFYSTKQLAWYKFLSPAFQCLYRNSAIRSAGLPQQNGNLIGVFLTAIRAEDVLLGLMDHVGAKVLAHDAIPRFA